MRTGSVVTLTIGANDFDETHATDPACLDLSCYSSTMSALPGHITTILQKTHALLPAGGTVVVTGYWHVFLDGQVAASLGPTYIGVSNALTVAANNALLAASSAFTARYTDLHQPFKDAGNPDHTQLLAADSDHPNAAGHQLIATAIHATLAGSSPVSSGMPRTNGLDRDRPAEHGRVRGVSRAPAQAALPAASTAAMLSAQVP